MIPKPIERRRAVRDSADHYDGFTDQRQPVGTVATWVRVTGGHLVRSRVDYLHLSRVLRARAVPPPPVLPDAPAMPTPRLITWTLPVDGGGAVPTPDAGMTPAPVGRVTWRTLGANGRTPD